LTLRPLRNVIPGRRLSSCGRRRWTNRTPMRAWTAPG
jgi:hypothetical protein